MTWGLFLMALYMKACGLGCRMHMEELVLGVMNMLGTLCFP
jgi:hypothetical protein